MNFSVCDDNIPDIDSGKVYCERHLEMGNDMTQQYALEVNEQTYKIEVEPDMPLLWVLRDILGLTGTKYSCGVGLCGACTVHLDGEAIRSCQVPVSDADGKTVKTIEGLSPDGSHPLQRAWQDECVVQCGYCQAGQVMTAAALLNRNPNPTEDEVVHEMCSRAWFATGGSSMSRPTYSSGKPERGSNSCAGHRGAIP